MKKISVIITTYNSGKTIQRAIDSVLNQDQIDEKFDIELIIVVDCSTDNTLDIINANNLEYISTGTNSGGPNRGRNIGLKKATGDYICIMDHDDEWALNKITSQLALADIAPIITSGYTTINNLTNRKNYYVNSSHDSNDYIYYDKNVTFLKKII